MNLVLPSKFSKSWSFWRPHVEALALCLLAFVFDRQFSSYLYEGANLKLYALSILLITAQYGTIPGISSVIFATLLFYVDHLPLYLPDDDFYSYSWRLGQVPLPWFIAATLVGEIVMRHRRERARAESELRAALKREQVFLKAFTELEKLKDQRERELASITGSPAQIFKIVANASPRTQDSIIRATISLVQMLIQPRKFSLYLLRNDSLRLIRAKGWSDADTYREHFSIDDALAKAIVSDLKTVSIRFAKQREILNEQGLIALPIADQKSGKIFGMIKIEDIDWSEMSPAQCAILNHIAQWAGSMFMFTQQLKIAYLMPNPAAERRIVPEGEQDFN